MGLFAGGLRRDMSRQLQEPHRGLLAIISGPSPGRHVPHLQARLQSWSSGVEQRGGMGYGNRATEKGRNPRVTARTGRGASAEHPPGGVPTSPQAGFRHDHRVQTRLAGAGREARPAGLTTREPGSLPTILLRGGHPSCPAPLSPRAPVLAAFTLL